MLRIDRIVTSVASIGVILSGGTAQAQSANTDSNDFALEEVVITAERRTEGLQNTAASVSVRTGDELQREGRFTLQQILEDIPGVTGGAAAGISGVRTATPANGVRIREHQRDLDHAPEALSDRLCTQCHGQSVQECGLDSQ